MDEFTLGSVMWIMGGLQKVEIRQYKNWESCALRKDYQIIFKGLANYEWDIRKPINKATVQYVEADHDTIILSVL